MLGIVKRDGKSIKKSTTKVSFGGTKKYKFGESDKDVLKLISLFLEVFGGSDHSLHES